jgi:hypothetical protein
VDNYWLVSVVWLIVICELNNIVICDWDILVLCLLRWICDGNFEGAKLGRVRCRDP